MDINQNDLCAAFGLVLKVERARHRLTQEELAHRADLNVTFLSRTERGLSQPTLWTLHKIARALGLSLSDMAQLIEEAVDRRQAKPLPLTSASSKKAQRKKS